MGKNYFSPEVDEQNYRESLFLKKSAERNA